MSRAVKILALLAPWLIAAANLACYVLVLHQLALTHDTHVPPVRISTLKLLAATFSLGVAAAAVVALRIGPSLATDRRLRASLLLASLVVWCTALYFRPLTSVDNSFNLLMARTLVVHHENPYLVPSGTHKEDPVYPLISERWYATPMVYGPLYAATSAIPVVLTPNPLAESLLLRALNLAGYLGAGLLVFRFLRRKSPDSAWTVLAFWFLNPIALLEIGNAGHNEGMLVLFMALLAIALHERKLLHASLAIVGAALIKHWPLALAPALLGISATWRSRAKTALIAACAFIAPWAAFWVGPATVAGIRALAANDDGARYFSPFRLLAYLVASATRQQNPFHFAAAASFICFMLCLAAVTFFVWRKRLSPLSGAFFIALAYHLVWLNWLQPWYVIALLPFFFLLLKERPAIYATTAIGIVSICAYATSPPIMYTAAVGAALFVTVLLGKKKTATFIAASQRDTVGDNSATTVR